MSKLSEKLLSLIENTNFIEMAYSLKKVKAKIRNSTDTININLMKLFLWGKSCSESQHWISKTVIFLPYIEKIEGRKQNRGYLTQKEILDQSWYGFEDSLDDHFETLVYLACEKEGRPTVDYSKLNRNDFYNFVKEYYMVLSYQLSNKGVIYDSLENVLKELVNKYGVENI